jgi:aspartyl-tRNA synthetase
MTCGLLVGRGRHQLRSHSTSHDIWLICLQGGSTALGTLRLHLLEAALNKSESSADMMSSVYNPAIEDYIVPKNPHFLWVTEFPLFTRDDVDKDILAQGRWSSSHHPFTAPMWQDIEAMYNGQIDTVQMPIHSFSHQT